MKHWSDYWRHSAALNSFAESDSASGYVGEVADFWHQHLANYKEQAHLVDVGTGNGALAVLIGEYARKQGYAWNITGIDAADIDPMASLQAKPELVEKLKGIKFLGSTPIEKLPFEDNSIDTVTSQFAFEYADTTLALKEILRVLKSNGEFVAMAHHAESSLVNDSQRGLAIFDYTLNNSPLFMQVDLLFQLASRALAAMDYASWNRTQECIAISKSIQWTMTIISERFNQKGDEAWVNDIFGQVINLIKAVTTAQNAERALSGLGGIYGALQAHQLRLKEQIAAALTREKLIVLQEQAKQNGAEMSSRDFAIDGELFAYVVTTRKR